MTLVLLGAHGVGKSTIGAALARRLGCVFHDEIGRWLMEHVRPKTQTAQDPQFFFDLAVFTAELARDRCWPQEIPRIVESWHPVNLAYAYQRSPTLIEQFLPDIKAEVSRNQIQIIPLRRKHRCQSEPGDADFFDQIGRDAEKISQTLGLSCLPPIANDGSVDETVSKILTYFQKDKITCQKSTSLRAGWNGYGFVSRTRATAIRR